MPDMGEGDHGKLAAPAQRQRKAAEDAETVVAAVLSALEAAVGDRPHAVDAMGAVWFGQHVFKAHLKQTRRRIGVKGREVKTWILHAWECFELRMPLVRKLKPLR